MFTAAGEFAVTGSPTTLVYLNTSGDIYLFANAGQFLTTGEDTSVASDRLLAAATGELNLSGSAARVLAGRALPGEAGEFQGDGGSVSFGHGRTFLAGAGVFTLTGSPSILQLKSFRALPGDGLRVGADSADLRVSFFRPTLHVGSSPTESKIRPR